MHNLSPTERMAIENQIEVMRAYAGGKQIQGRTTPQDPWRDLPRPEWNFYECEYRVKPPVCEAIVVFSEAGLPAQAYKTDEQLQALAHCARINGVAMMFKNGVPLNALASSVR